MNKDIKILLDFLKSHLEVLRIGSSDVTQILGIDGMFNRINQIIEEHPVSDDLAARNLLIKVGTHIRKKTASIHLKEFTLEDPIPFADKMYEWFTYETILESEIYDFLKKK